MPDSEEQSEVVGLYISDGETNAVSEDSRQPRKRRPNEWHLEREFEDRDAAVTFLKDQEQWSVQYTNKTLIGNKVFYRCNRVKRRDDPCTAARYLLYVNNSLKVELYRTENDHTCMNSSRRGLCEKAKEEIKKFLDLGIKPKKMIEKLRDEGLEGVQRTQVYAFVSKARRDRLGPATINLSDLEAWCADNTARPTEADDAYVFAHEFAENDGAGEVSFKLSISTPRLLQNAASARHLAIDATYKLNWQGFPVLIVGTTDSDRHFHPLSISICSNERMESFQFILESLKRQVPELSPSHLIADASQAIREAFHRVFGYDRTLLMCWAHAFRNISKHSNLVEGSKIEMLDGIRLLQIAPDTETFSKGVELFISKYHTRERRFVEYLNDMWFTTHNTWYEGASDRLPSTNNGLESFNNVIKKEETLRERMPIGQFANQCLISASRWSKQYAFDKMIVMSPTLDTGDWTSAYQWGTSSKEVRSQRSGDLTEYFCPSGGKVSLSAADVRRAKKRSWRNFDEFKKAAFAVWIVSMKDDNWRDARCSCPHFLKNYKCKHTLGMAIRLQLVHAPPEAKQIPLGQKRKRGRPKKATQALSID